MPYGQILTDSITDSSGGVLAPSSSVFRNRIINGAMQIDQRNAGASVTPTTDAQYGSCDRWSYFLSQASKFSVQQNAASVTPPVGFTNYLGVTSLSAYTPTSNDYFGIVQKIEGYNVADLAFGNASAATITISFWVRSSLTGTFGGAITNSAYNRSYPFTYTISSANTWEKETITIVGDTSGTWLTTNGSGLVVQLSLGAAGTNLGTAGAWTGSYKISATGTTNVVATNGATFYITGVQLEKGVTATSFDYRPYTTELQLCQRYLPAVTFDSGIFGLAAVANGQAIGTTSTLITVPFSVKARTGSTGITVSNPTSLSLTNSTGGLITATTITASSSSDSAANIVVNAASGLTAGNSTCLIVNNSNARILFTGCEL
jgi:hypothetical protein